MASKHEELIRQVEDLSRSCASTERQVRALENQLDGNIRHLRALLGQGSGGAIGQMMVGLSSAANEIDRVTANVRGTKQAADEYVAYLRRLM